MVSVSPDNSAEIREHGDFTDDEISSIRAYAKNRLEAVIDSEDETVAFDVMKGSSIVDKPVHEVEAGETVVFWPNDIEAVANEVDADSEKVNQYFKGGYGVGLKVDQR